MKRSLLAVLLIVAFIGCSGYAIISRGDDTVKTTTEEKFDIPPELIVTIGKENINSVSFINLEDRYDDDFFKFAFEEDEIGNIKYVKNNEKITLSFGKIPPDSITITDILLSTSGQCLFGDRHYMNVSPKKKGNNFIFYLQSNPNSFMRSDYALFKQYRGFKVTATWDKQEYMYFFVIQTNIL